MKIAHLIMAHKNPAQLERLLAALAHPDALCFVHLDRQCDRRAFAYLAGLPGVRLLARRYAVRWASYRFTRAIFECTRAVLAAVPDAAFVNLLSGQDYPLRPAADVHAFLARHRGQSFMAFEAEGSAWWQHARSRVEQYHSTAFRFRGQYALQRLANRLLPRRQFPLPYTLYGSADGSWWTLDRAAAEYLVRFVDEHPRLRRFSYLTWGSDEFLPATILLNSPLRGSIVNDSHRYIDWSGGGANPRVLTTADFGALARSPKLYARKFDAAVDARVLKWLDARRAQQEAVARRPTRQLAVL